MARLFCLLLFAGLVIAQPDPSPRMVYLGKEDTASFTDPTGAPGRVFYYVDKATGNEIICFAGINRETLSCLQSGRKR